MKKILLRGYNVLLMASISVGLVYYFHTSEIIKLPMLDDYVYEVTGSTLDG